MIDLRERAGANPIVEALERIIERKRQREQDVLSRRATEAQIQGQGQIVVGDGKTWLVNRRTGEKRDLGIAPPAGQVEGRNISDIINEIAKISGAAEKVPEDVLESPIFDAALGPLREEAMGKAGLEEVQVPGEKRKRFGIDWLARDIPARTEIRKKGVSSPEERKKKRPPKPEEYPDAKWSEEHQMWTIIKNGRLMGIK